MVVVLRPDRIASVHTTHTESRWALAADVPYGFLRVHYGAARIHSAHVPHRYCGVPYDHVEARAPTVA